MSAVGSGLFVLGTSSSVAPLEVRERLHVGLDDLYGTLERLARRSRGPHGALPLATCSRTEVYAVSGNPEASVRLLRALLSHHSGLAPTELARHSYVRRGTDAVRHLFRVAAGLDSVVHGEAQILGQVREAYRHPRNADVAEPTLHRLFEHALATGKRVRSETGIGRGAASVAAAAVDLVRGRIGGLDGVDALVLGAGDTAAIVARLLRKAGVRQIVIANRTPSRARTLAQELDARVVPLAEVGPLVREADLIVGAVAECGALVGPDVLRAAHMAQDRRHRTFVDLAHPRNFDPALSEMPSVTLLDLEHVFHRVRSVRDKRAAEVPRAEEIVDEECHRYLAWLCSRDNASLVRAVRSRFLEIARAEADRHASGLDPEGRERMRRLARSVARTLLHPPTVAMRNADASSEHGRRLLDSAATLFAVEADLTPSAGDR